MKSPRRWQARIFHCNTLARDLVAVWKTAGQISVTEQEEKCFRNINELADWSSTLSGCSEGDRAKILRKCKCCPCKFVTTARYVPSDLAHGHEIFDLPRAAVLFFALPVCAFSATNVVNLSHYDMMRPDFATMKRQGIVGVIHEATYPPFVRDPKYLDQANGGAASGTALGSISLR